MNASAMLSIAAVLSYWKVHSQRSWLQQRNETAGAKSENKIYKNIYINNMTV